MRKQEPRLFIKSKPFSHNKRVHSLNSAYIFDRLFERRSSELEQVLSEWKTTGESKLTPVEYSPKSPKKTSSLVNLSAKERLSRKREASCLIKWLHDQQLTSLLEDETDKAESIIKIGLSELQRQIYQESTDRGSAFSELLSLYTKCLQSYANQVRQTLLEKINDLHSQIDNMGNVSKIYEEEVNVKLNQEQSQNDSLTTTIKQQASELENLHSQINELRDENLKLKLLNESKFNLPSTLKVNEGKADRRFSQYIDRPIHLDSKPSETNKLQIKRNELKLPLSVNLPETNELNIRFGSNLSDQNKMKLPVEPSFNGQNELKFSFSVSSMEGQKASLTRNFTDQNLLTIPSEQNLLGFHERKKSLSRNLSEHSEFKSPLMRQLTVNVEHNPLFVRRLSENIDLKPSLSRNLSEHSDLKPPLPPKLLDQNEFKPTLKRNLSEHSDQKSTPGSKTPNQKEPRFFSESKSSKFASRRPSINPQSPSNKTLLPATPTEQLQANQDTSPQSETKSALEMFKFPFKHYISKQLEKFNLEQKLSSDGQKSVVSDKNSSDSKFSSNIEHNPPLERKISGVSSHNTRSGRNLKALPPFRTSKQVDFIIDYFYKSKKTQTENPKANRTTMTELRRDCQDVEIQTEEMESVSISIEASFSDGQEVPNAIVVTTENNDPLIEYAYVPNKIVANNPILKRVNTLGSEGLTPTFNRASTGFPMEAEPPKRMSSLQRMSTGYPIENDSSPSRRVSEQELSTINEPTFSELSGSEDDATNSYNYLTVPDLENLSSESLKKHSPNPDPFTDVFPELAPMKRKRSRRSPGMRDRETQTDTDLILEDEENEILQNMIDYKTELLRKVEHSLTIAKSKLIGLNAQNSSKEQELSQTLEESKNMTPDELFHHLQLLGKIPSDFDLNSWKQGFKYAQEEPKPTKKKTAKLNLISDLVQKSLAYSPEKFNRLTQKMVIRKINAILSSATAKENNGEKLGSLINYSYEYIKTVYQDTITSNKKFVELVSAMFKYSEVLKVKVFIKLMGLGKYVDIEDCARPIQSFTFYMNLVSWLRRSKLGIVLPFYNSGDTQYIPLFRALECVKDTFEQMLNPSHIEALIRTLESVSKPDPHKVNSGGVVNQDFLLEVIMDEYDKHSRDVLQAVNLLVQGFDIENNGKLHVSDLVMAVRHLSYDKIDVVMNRDGYSENVSLLCDKNNFIEVDNVIELCIRRSLVSMSDITEYLRESFSYQTHVKDMVQSALIKNIEILNLVMVHKEKLGITSDIERLWTMRISLLKQDLDVNLKAVYLSFKIFMNELKRLEELIQ